MFTILIPVLKQGYLQSQLHWLSEQTYKNFCVVVMDVNWKQNRYQPWASKKYPFKLWHMPLVHNVQQHKRYDFSIKNNLALLSPTDHFVFLSDTHYINNRFCQAVADEIIMHRSRITFFESNTLLYNAFFPDTNYVDLGGESTHVSKPAMLFDSKTFFYLLNGYDEVTTYCHGYENMVVRASLLVGDKIDTVRKAGFTYHILHENHDNDFGSQWRKPCERCSVIFASWKFDLERDSGDFPEGNSDPELLRQFTARDSILGVNMFQCPNCGFCGTTESVTLDTAMTSQCSVSAPKFALDGDVGRDLVKMYEMITTQVNNRMNAKVAYLKTTY